MANEITVTGSLAYEDSENSDESLSPADFLLTVANKKYVKHKQNVGTAEEAVDLGELSALGYALFINRDTTNFIELRTGTGSTKFAKLKPNGGFAIFHFGTGVTAPYAIADTAACQMEYFIINT